MLTLKQVEALNPRARVAYFQRLARVAVKNDIICHKSRRTLASALICESSNGAVFAGSILNGKLRPVYGYNNGYKLRLGMVAAGIRPIKDGKILGYPISAYFNKYVF